MTERRVGGVNVLPEDVAVDGTSPEEADGETARTAARESREGGRSRGYLLKVNLGRLALVLAFLAAWEFLPRVQALSSRSHVFDPFFISSPSRVGDRLAELFWGSQSNTPMLDYAWRTVSTAVLGLVVGMALGMFIGMALGSVKVLSDLFRPFIIAFNTIPKIAIVPIILILFGPTTQSTLTTAVITAFMVTFFNAYSGARSVQPQLIDNARLLGASGSAVMLRVRLPYVFAWTVSILPLAATFSVIMVVTAEILMGVPGLGRLISNASTSSDADLTFALVVILAIVGGVIVGLATLFSRRYLHWWAR